MWEVNIALVRDFFELEGFQVFPLRREKGLRKNQFDLWVENIAPVKIEPTFFLDPYSIRGIRTALVKIMGWHGEIFTASMVRKYREILKIKEMGEEEKRLATEKKGVSRIIVFSRIPKKTASRKDLERVLREEGFTQVITFEEILWSLVEKIEKRENYSSPLLEVMRIFKVYRMIKSPQLEFSP